MEIAKTVDKAKQWLSERPKAIAAVAILGIPAALLLVGGYIITTAAIFALISMAAVSVLIWKMHIAKSGLVKKAYNLMVKHPLATDVLATVAVFAVSPKGIIGMLGAAVFAVMFSGLLIALPKEKKDEENTQISEEQVAEASAAL